jgi:hypothetical protein
MSWVRSWRGDPVPRSPATSKGLCRADSLHRRCPIHLCVPEIIPGYFRIGSNRKMTPLGTIILVAGLSTAVLSKRWLYRLFVFWSLFSASSVLNVGEGENASAIQVWMLLGFLWLCRLLMEKASNFSFSIDRRVFPQCAWLLAFLAVASLSLVMPIYIDGRLAIAAPTLFGTGESPLFFSAHNLTQLLYLILGCAIAIAVAHFNLRDEARLETERTILLSALVVAAWGLFQFWCNVRGVPYPYQIFNNSASVSGHGFLERIYGYPRISSVATEPSTFAQSLITLLPMTIPAWLKRGAVFSVNWDRFCSIVLLVALLLSTSSVAYFGIVALPVLAMIVLIRAKAIRRAKAWMLIAAGVVLTTAAIAMVMATVPVVRDVIDLAIFFKANSGSGLERAMTIRDAWSYFREYPLLGIGWGSATSQDLIVKLLSNIGVIGTLAFLAAMYNVLQRSWRSLILFPLPAGLSRAVWLLGFSLFLATSVISAFPLAFGNFWLVIGMTISTGCESESAATAVSSALESSVPREGFAE